jgi:hypothetical protein
MQAADDFHIPPVQQRNLEPTADITVRQQHAAGDQMVPHLAQQTQLAV